MNLVGAIGFRTVYSCAEVAGFLGMTKRQVEYLHGRGQLVKFSIGKYPYRQKDVNEFISRLNCGEIVIGARKMRTSV